MIVSFKCLLFKLKYIYFKVLGQDYNACMRRLFKFPPISDSHLFIERALFLKSSTSPVISPAAPVVTQEIKPVSNNSHSNNRRSVYQENNNSSKIANNRDPIFDKINKVIPLATTAVKQLLNTEIDVPISPSHSLPTYEEIYNELNQLKNTHLHMGNRLERIVYTIQKDILPK
jgi:hypothetical protein